MCWMRAFPGVAFFPGFTRVRPLHSFPTRLSSDLASLISQPSGEEQGTGWYGFFVAVPAFAIANAGTATKKDRKSTRLNSSHTESSYAVFRLKKKSADAMHAKAAHPGSVRAALAAI